jgi:2-oxoglutarate dehydrogenase E1 component
MNKQLSMDDTLLSGTNAPFIEGLFEAYRQNPDSVPPEWHGYFDQLQLGAEPGRPAGHVSPGMPQRAPVVRISAQDELALAVERKQIAVLQLINAYRFLGVRHADLDPLKHQEKPHVPELDPGYYGLADADMNTVFGTGSLVGPPRAPLKEILQALRQT